MRAALSIPHWRSCKPAELRLRHPTMDRKYYLDLAASGIAMPIGTHLILHNHEDPDAIVQDGTRLGQVIEESARHFKMPLAFPLMDLKLEKEALLLAQGIAPEQIDTFHFDDIPEEIDELQTTKNMDAVCGAIQHVATETDLVPVGMCIGPFSLMSKLISDPITPVFLAADGSTADEDKEIALAERLLDIGFNLIKRYLDVQIQAGAKAIVLCEPAANKVYFSPNQLKESYDTWDKYVMKYNLALSEHMRSKGADLIFHNCGELLDGMVERIGKLDSAMLSLGCSRMLWEDAKLIPKDTVLFGNLPTKQFYSDALFSVEKVEQLSKELKQRMGETGHPFILGSECDVLSVPGSEQTIKAKVDAFMKA